MGPAARTCSRQSDLVKEGMESRAFWGLMNSPRGRGWQHPRMIRAMSSFFAHGMVGMTVWGFARRNPVGKPFQNNSWYAVAAAVSILPDLDTYVGLRHRGITHTLGFAVASAVLIAAGAAVVHRRHALRLVLPFAIAIWLHGFMDLLVGGGPRVELFWPLGNEGFPPIDGGLPIHGVPRTWSRLLSVLMERTLPGMVVEAGIFGPMFAASLARQRRSQVVLLAAGALTWLVYGILR